MRNIILKVHKIFYGYNNKHYKTRNYITKIICNIMSRFCDVTLNLYLKIYGKLGLYPSPLKEENDIIVSLTSFPKRIDSLWMVIDSMFHQTIRPSKIFLYLSKEEFPKGKESLPKRLLNYENLGLNICFRDENLMPHNKYYYALQEHCKTNVITIDDDLYYHKNLISNLWHLHKKFPNCVCSNTIDIIQFEKNGNFKPYKQWTRPIDKQAPSILNLALGYTGVLYPSNIYKSIEVFNKLKIRELSLKADDLWLKIHQVREQIPVVTGDHFCTGVSILGTQAQSLMASNCGNNENDSQWNNLCKYYNINKDSFYNI